MFKQQFEGGFIKVKLNSPQQENFGRPKAQSIYESYCISYPNSMEFDEEIYNKVKVDIKNILGEKEKYSVEEAVLYFQKKYLAHRIPYEYMLNYFDTYYREKFEPTPYGPENEFEYDDMSGEKNVTLFIDTIFNEDLKKRYPKIEETKKQKKAMLYDMLKVWERDLERDVKAGAKWLTEELIKQKRINYKNFKRQIDEDKIGSNPIIIIGYIEENIINSMYLVNIDPIGIDDIHYEMYYFYKHS